MSKVTWKTEPDPHDYPAAASYLSLIATTDQINDLIDQLKTAPLSHYKAKDMLRASGLPLLPPDNPHVAADLTKVKTTKHSPQSCSPRRPRLDPLAHASEVAVAALGGVSAVGMDQQHADLVGGEAFQFLAGQALVGQHDHPLAQRTVVAGVAEEFFGDLAFAQLGIGQTPRQWHALGGGDQIQRQPPIPARVRRAVALARPPGQL
ncbi:MAG TPA: hypothetical protein VN327_15265 [Pseudonocardiaceae bacterium]|nr:hypothetical protein [Pseudonocardiaceae bacterium]